MLRTLSQRCPIQTFQRLISQSRPLQVTNIYDEEQIEKETVPQNAKVVICGGGIMGFSVAYYLSQLGWGQDTVLVEQDLFSSKFFAGSGLVGVFKPTLPQVKLTKASVELYKQIGQWQECGSLNLARTRDRMTVFRRMKAQSVSWDIACEILTPKQCQEKCPFLNVDDLLGGLWIPGDGLGDPNHIRNRLYSLRKDVRMFENCAITRVHQTNGKVSGVDTTRGPIKCDYFVNCGGLWARSVGQLSEPYVKVPLHAVEHHYLIIDDNKLNVSRETPVVRDQDGHIYLREYNNCLLAGGFEPDAKPVYINGHTASNTDARLLPEDWDHFHVLLEQLLHRVPQLASSKFSDFVNHAEAFSPDCKWIVGEAPEIRNYFVAAGMKTIGISAAGGVGKLIAEIIVNGETSFDIYELEVSRFLGLHNNRKFLRDRVKEVPALHYGIQYPFHEFNTGRNLRMSPVYPKLREAGAVFGQVMGYERPSWFEDFESSDFSGDWSTSNNRMAYTKTFGKPPWFDRVAEEYAACRERIGISDYSSFTKIDMWSKGKEVVEALQFVCSNDVDVPIGSIIHTGMQNKYGGYENDCSLARLSENHYMMIAPTIQQTRCKVYLQKHLPSTVTLSDVTSMFTALAIMGPFTRTLLSELTDTDLSPKNFPFFTFKMLDIGLANGIRTMNLTHTGELGYVLYIPNEFALHVYSSLIEAGEKFGIRHAGYFATRALRVEKFYAFWGQDLDTRTTPLECGRAWRVKFDKKVDFIGRDALITQREEGIKRMYIQLILNDHCHETDLWPWGGEPIYRDGKYVGMTTTTGYGFTFKKQVCLGFIENRDENGELLRVTNDYVLGGDYEVDIAGIRFNAKVNIHSPFLPTKYPDKERDVYQATRDKHDDNVIIKAVR